MEEITYSKNIAIFRKYNFLAEFLTFRLNSFVLCEKNSPLHVCWYDFQRVGLLKSQFIGSMKRNTNCKMSQYSKAQLEKFVSFIKT